MIDYPFAHPLTKLLQQLTADLSSAVTPEQVAEVIVNKGLAALGGHLAAVYVWTDDHEALELLNRKGMSPESYTNFRQYSPSFPGPLSDAILTGQPVYIETQQDYVERYPGLESYVTRHGTQATACLPLIANNRILGGVTFSFPYMRVLNEDERAFLTVLSQQTAQALERAYLYDAEHKARQRLAFLADASKILAHSLDYQTTLNSISELAVPAMADWYHVDILNEEDKVQRIAAKHVDTEKIPLLYELNQHFPADFNAHTGAGKVIRTAESDYVRQVQPNLIERYAQNAGHLELLKTFDTGSYVIVPLTARGRTFGAITFAFAHASGKLFTAADLEMAEELGRRAAVAIDNARLYQDMQLAVERTLILQRLTAAFSQALTPQEVANIVAQGLEAIGARAAAVMMLTPAKDALQLIGVHNVNPSLQQRYQTIPIDADTMVNDVVRHNIPIWIRDLDDYQRLYPNQVEHSRRVGTHAGACLPLIAEGRTVGVLGISFAKEQAFHEEDRALIIALAQQCAQALERARLYSEAQALAAVEERQRLARELHDAVSQTLFSATTIAQTLPILWERNPVRGAEQTTQMVTLNQAAMAEMRTLLLELRPEAILNTGLDNLLHQLAQAAKGRRLIDMVLHTDTVKAALPADVHVTFYRVAQESINNALKHTRAAQIKVDLSDNAEDVRLSVRDNGDGFDTASPSGGLGLQSMRERAAGIGASLYLESEVGKGTEIRLSWKRPTTPPDAGAATPSDAGR